MRDLVLKRFFWQEDGQTLVYVALAMVALLAFVALAIDGGYIYAERRHLQNAADAGALAGAYEICFGSPALVVSTAKHYAIDRNGAQDALVDTPEPYQVYVQASATIDMFFAGVIGLETVDVNADATAACGAATSACGLWPIALRAGRWNTLYNTGCGHSFYILAGNGSGSDPDCLNTYQCDLVGGDGIDDVIGDADRNWLDFSDVVSPQYPDACVQPGCGANELACLIAHGTGSIVTLPACIPGNNGVSSNVADEVQLRVGDVVAIPLFTNTDCSAGHVCPGDETSYATSFGCLEVRGWEEELVIPRQDGQHPPWKGSAIVAAIACGQCDTFCGSTPGGPPQPGGVNAVSLIQ